MRARSRCSASPTPRCSTTWSTHWRPATPLRCTATVDRVVEAGHDPRRFAADLLDRFRDLILLDAVPDAGERGLLDVPQDQLAAMADQADPPRRRGTLTRFAEIVHTALIEMRGTTAPRLVLELLCARMLLPDASADAAALLQRLERLERRLSRHGRATSAAPAGNPCPGNRGPDNPPRRQPRPRQAADLRQPRPRLKPAPPRSRSAPGRPHRAGRVTATRAGSAPGQLDATALRRLWPEVLETVKQSSRRTRALLDNAQITDAVGELVTLGAPSALARMIADDSNTSVLRQALTKVVGGSGASMSNRRTARRPRPRRQLPASASAVPEPDPRDDTDPESDASPRPSSIPRPRRCGCCRTNWAPARSTADLTPRRRPPVAWMQGDHRPR